VAPKKDSLSSGDFVVRNDKNIGIQDTISRPLDNPSRMRDAKTGGYVYLCWPSPGHEMRAVRHNGQAKHSPGDTCLRKPEAHRVRLFDVELLRIAWLWFT
jgi:hypothetical protein